MLSKAGLRGERRGNWTNLSTVQFLESLLAQTPVLGLRVLRLLFQRKNALC